ncbi:3-oxoacyl-ACP synthase [Paenibacillus sp.]|jgi:3-oxoacyl-[acyl-carrier-protein] synthase-3|uniref:3-oxoacyl-ACP synthase n=1 Tax=Paenibacillus sp. TaxID=58172 RepID=UPI0028190ABD|nr:3-oxoacyl-ACP synthase [Paenibacillus sp.]MDR0270561.1 3-oxoacyl-ACP synthase [Paenibacillus sp.]
MMGNQMIDNTEGLAADDGIRLIAVGLYVPPNTMTSSEIAAAAGIPQDVVETKLGILQKPVPGADDDTCEMGIRAAKEAIERSGIDPMEIDMVIYIGEEYKEYPVWTAALKLQEEIGARRAFGFDMALRCCTAIAGVKTAKAMMLGNASIRTVLLAGGYRNGDLIDMADPGTRFMINLAAGGGALILRRGAGPAYPEVMESALITDGSFSEDVIVSVGGTKNPLTADLIAAGEPKFRVTDPEGMKRRLDQLSMQRFVQVVKEATTESGYVVPEIEYMGLLHMKRSAHRFVLETLGIPAERAIYLEEYGHMGQFDPVIHLELISREGRMAPGKIAVLAAAGIGYAWGALTLRWGESACPWN